MAHRGSATHQEKSGLRLYGIAVYGLKPDGGELLGTDQGGVGPRISQAMRTQVLRRGKHET